MSDTYPTGRFAEKTVILQKSLVKAGFLNERDVDGWFGPKTAVALDEYMESLEKKPLPPKPWWKSNRGRGLAKMGLGIVVTAASFIFPEQAGNVDTGAVVDTVYQAGPLIQQVLEVVGALITALGFGQSAIGAAKAEQPLDTGLIAKVKDREVRIGQKKPETGADRARDFWLDSSDN
jgi:hypothetical protein